MKKVVFGLIALGFISLSSFTTIDSKEIVAHSCTYALYNADNKFLTYWTIDGISDNLPCSSEVVKAAAIATYNLGQANRR